MNGHTFFYKLRNILQRRLGIERYFCLLGAGKDVQILEILFSHFSFCFDFRRFSFFFANLLGIDGHRFGSVVSLVDANKSI